MSRTTTKTEEKPDDCSSKKLSPFFKLLIYCKQLQHLLDVEQESKWEEERERSVPTENCKKERESSSSSSYDGDLSEQDDAPLLGEENMVINKATQVKAKVKSRKSQAVLEECLKCAERKLKIRETGDYALKREKWLAVARRMKELVLCSGIKIFNIPAH